MVVSWGVDEVLLGRDSILYLQGACLPYLLGSFPILTWHCFPLPFFLVNNVWLDQLCKSFLLKQSSAIPKVSKCNHTPFDCRSLFLQFNIQPKFCTQCWTNLKLLGCEHNLKQAYGCIQRNWNGSLWQHLYKPILPLDHTNQHARQNTDGASVWIIRPN